MATAYSDEVAVGSYNRIRLRVEYSGTSATCYIEFRRTSAWTTTWADSQASIEFNGTTNSAPYYYSGTVGTSWIQLTSAGGFSVSTSGGTYGWSFNNPSGGVLGCSGQIYVPAQFTPPTGVSGSTLTDGTVRGRAKVQVSVNNWGTASSAYAYYACKSANVDGERWGRSTTSQFTWDGLIPSTSTTCAITTWYPGAKNNNGLSNTGAARYIASPGGQNLSVTGTNRTTTIKSTLTYRGGITNSATSDTAPMSRYLLWYKRSDQDWTDNTNPQQDKPTTAKTCTFDELPYTVFETGYNYDFLSCPVNVYGAYASNGGTLVRPTGIMATVDESSPIQAVFNISTTNPGGWLGQGEMAGYVIEYGTTTSYGETTSFSPSTEVTLENLQIGTTYYYRITGWNNFGLSSQTTGTFATADYFPPVAETPAWVATGDGFRVQTYVTHTGGITEDADTITGVSLRVRPVGKSTWEHTIIPFGAGRNIDILYDEGYDVAGDYEAQLVITNSSQISNTYSFILTAPAKPTVSAIDNFHNYPNTFQCTARTTSAGVGEITSWRFDTSEPASTGEKNETSELVVTGLRSALGLLFNTSYTANAKVWNTYGVWNQSSNFTFTTGKRFQFYIVNDVYSPADKKTVNPFFRFPDAPSTSRSISMVHFIVADALSEVSIGQDLSGHRLKFIEEPLFYTEDSVASVHFTNGKSIALAQDTDGLYKFGIWNGTTLETVFFNALDWEMSSYDLDSNWEIDSIVRSARGLAQAHAFATTSCKPIHYGD